VKRAELEIKGLEIGDYLIRYGGSVDRKLVSDVLKLSLPIVDAKLIGIEKV
jgi:ERCC4-type nuclease